MLAGSISARYETLSAIPIDEFIDSI